MAQHNKTFKVRDVTFTMVFVQGGTFSMGATVDQGSKQRNEELPVHKVTLDDYYIGQTEVTQALWLAVMGNNPSEHNENVQCPVTNVTWDDCIKFISRLNEITGTTFRLPTEAQWEFAARGGVKSNWYMYSGSNNLHEVAWAEQSPYNNSIHPVGEKKANELGIFDMTGNVYEWCNDFWDYYPTESAVRPQTNPTGPEPPRVGPGFPIPKHVIRSSCARSEPFYSRIASRGRLYVDRSDPELGLRLAL